MKSLLIIGAGSHGQVVKETAFACGYESIDFLDDKMTMAVGNINEAPYLAPHYDGVFIAIGNNALRFEITENLERFEGIQIVTLIHPMAYVSPSAVIGKGTIIEPNVVVNTHVVVGEGCIISVGAILDHDSSIGFFSHINAGAVCMAGSKVNGFTKVDAGETVKGF